MTPQELKEYFRSVDLPNTLELYPGTTITDMQGFLGYSFTLVENFKDDISKCSAWWRLTRLYEIISASQESVNE